jgi:hypothetical protein
MEQDAANTQADTNYAAETIGTKIAEHQTHGEQHKIVTQQQIIKHVIQDADGKQKQQTHVQVEPQEDAAHQDLEHVPIVENSHHIHQDVITI